MLLSQHKYTNKQNLYINPRKSKDNTLIAIKITVLDAKQHFRPLKQLANLFISRENDQVLILFPTL